MNIQILITVPITSDKIWLKLKKHIALQKMEENEQKSKNGKLKFTLSKKSKTLESSMLSDRRVEDSN